MSPERARFGVVVEGDMGGLPQMLLHPLPQEYRQHEDSVEELNPWMTVTLYGDRAALIDITLSSTNSWVEVEAVTIRENILRGTSRSAVNAVKTRCKNGHEFTPENTYMTKQGSRSCRECHRLYQLEWRPRHARRTQP